MSGRTYHHGDLQRALQDEALGLIRERGLQALSLREVAARAGVSTAAPYHHFADKATLVRALGYEALGELDRAMAAAEAAADDPCERLVALGKAYVTFARRRPDYAAVMRAPEMSIAGEPAVVPEHGRAWERLRDAVVVCQQAGALAPGDPLPLTFAMWALAEGLVALLAAGPLAAFAQQYGGEDHVVDTVLRAVVRLPG